MTDKAALFLYYLRIIAPDYPEPVPEFRFALPRRWRFDFAWPNKMTAVEVEGNAWHVAGGGRHMQDSDLEKYNEATRLGWKIYRFSPGMLERDPDKCIGMVIE